MTPIKLWLTAACSLALAASPAFGAGLDGQGQGGTFGGAGGNPGGYTQQNAGSGHIGGQAGGRGFQAAQYGGRSYGGGSYGGGGNQGGYRYQNNQYGYQNNEGGPNGQSGAPVNQAGANGPVTQAEVRQMLREAGLHNIRILDESYLVRATTPSGHTVLMVVNPPGAAPTGLNAGNGQSQRQFSGGPGGQGGGYGTQYGYQGGDQGQGGSQYGSGNDYQSGYQGNQGPPYGNPLGGDQGGQNPYGNRGG